MHRIYTTLWLGVVTSSEQGQDELPRRRHLQSRPFPTQLVDIPFLSSPRSSPGGHSAGSWQLCDVDISLALALFPTRLVTRRHAMKFHQSNSEALSELAGSRRESSRTSSLRLSSVGGAQTLGSSESRKRRSRVWWGSSSFKESYWGPSISRLAAARSWSMLAYHGGGSVKQGYGVVVVETPSKPRQF